MTLDTFRCGRCGGAVPEHTLRATAAYPLGEAACPHCGTRVARLADGAWRPWLQTAMVFLGVLGILGLVRERLQGTWWPYALTVAVSALALWQFRARPDRVLHPVAVD
jgi:DNA-directed RNA polymerase subunit RPC12/RpoP